jgi:hypothetical protein
MATLSSEFKYSYTSGVDGSSEISIEKVKSPLDFGYLFNSAVVVGVVVYVEAHYKIFLK